MKQKLKPDKKCKAFFVSVSNLIFVSIFVITAFFVKAMLKERTYKSETNLKQTVNKN